MKAAIYKKYGPPEVVEIAEVEKPNPTENQILVKVHCSSVNRTDTGFRSAEYFISRFWSGLFKPKFQILGSEFSGIVESVGSNVTLFKVGEAVMGFNDKTFGGHAEYLCIDENGAVVKIPKNVDFTTAAVTTEGSHYALVDIVASKIKAGENALVYGATGAIGSAAVQILKHMGVNVTAVSNTKNVDLVKKLGAEEVIDYQTQDFTETQKRFHFIFDAVGKSSFNKCKPLLTERGVYISTELGRNGANVFLALFTPLFSKKKVLFPIPFAKKEDMEFLGNLVEQGAFKPVIEKIYSLDEIQEAHRHAQSGQKTGNLVVKIV